MYNTLKFLHETEAMGLKILKLYFNNFCDYGYGSSKNVSQTKTLTATLFTFVCYVFDFF